MRRSIVARILRVNHGGEHGAIRIYRAQIAVARWRCPELLPFLREALAHEEVHVARFRALMPARGSRPGRMMWLWAVGGMALGAATALLGRTGVLVCTQSVERTVHRHLDEQLRFLDDRDPELTRTILEIQQQEQGHLEFATQALGRPTLVGAALDRIITSATELLIWLSTQGDSVRLARNFGQPDLRPSKEKGRDLAIPPSISSR